MTHLPYKYGLNFFEQMNIICIYGGNGVKAVNMFGDFSRSRDDTFSY